MGKPSAGKKKKRLKKDVRLQNKEKRIKKKEQKKFLGELIEEEKVQKANTVLDKAVDGLAAMVQNLQSSLTEYLALIEAYQKTHDSKFTENSAAYSNLIAEELRKIFGWLDWVKEVLKEDLDFVETFSKDLLQENKLILKENRAERKQFRNLVKSSREGEGLDEETKEAILKKKEEVNQTVQSLNKRLIVILEQIQQVLQQDAEQVNGILGHRKELKKKWEKESTSWQGLQQLLQGIQLLLGNHGEFVATLKLRNRKTNIANQLMRQLTAEKQQLLAKKEVFDKEYQEFLLREEVEMTHEKHMGDIVKEL
ncbi:hypothetical protein HYX13_01385 [Candidatus Woesearchaeota archaeon]|nr:hypothetical protein [Candidatus Woesearchaeota archaeon]